MRQDDKGVKPLAQQAKRLLLQVEPFASKRKGPGAARAFPLI
jgi:hypothetical protein